MSIIVKPHDPKEEEALLAYLESMNYEYMLDDDSTLLSPAQQQEILERDRQFEAGETETFTLKQVLDHFGIKE
jgi:PHD/YefM family antitoxin component YafN of YafNO toxin-antitoxin module